MSSLNDVNMDWFRLANRNLFRKDLEALAEPVGNYCRDAIDQVCYSVTSRVSMSSNSILTDVGEWRGSVVAQIILLRRLIDT
jgi:hypothetical protein